MKPPFSYGFPMVYRCVQRWLNGSLRGHGGHRLRGLRMVQEDVSAEAAAAEQGSKRATCHATEPRKSMVFIREILKSAPNFMEIHGLFEGK